MATTPALAEDEHRILHRIERVLSGPESELRYQLEHKDGHPLRHAVILSFMDFKSLTDRVKGLFQSRGGADAAKKDAEEVVDVAKGEGSVTDKAKDAAEALKDPGAPAPGQ